MKPYLTRLLRRAALLQLFLVVFSLFVSLSPHPAQAAPGDIVTIAVRVGDGGSDSTVSGRLDGVTHKVSGEMLDNRSDGAHTLRVAAMDAAGNVGLDEVALSVDTALPRVGIDPVTRITSSNSQTITGTCESNALIAVSVNSIPVSVLSYTSATTWSCIVDGLVEGGNVITVTAGDAAANSATVSVIITLDTVAPVVTAPVNEDNNARTGNANEVR